MEICVLRCFLAVARKERVSGGGETRAMRIIARTARELQADYPRIRCHLYGGGAEDVPARMRAKFPES